MEIKLPALNALAVRSSILAFVGDDTEREARLARLKKQLLEDGVSFERYESVRAWLDDAEKVDVVSIQNAAKPGFSSDTYDQAIEIIKKAAALAECVVILECSPELADRFAGYSHILVVHPDSQFVGV